MCQFFITQIHVENNNLLTRNGVMLPLQPYKIEKIKSNVLGVACI